MPLCAIAILALSSTHYHHMSPQQSSYAIEIICKSIIVLDFHISRCRLGQFSCDASQLPRTCVLVVTKAIHFHIVESCQNSQVEKHNEFLKS